MFIKHWHRFPREAVESPSLDIQKPEVYTVLGNLLCVSLPEQRGWPG